jgi:hypothetical protein
MLERLISSNPFAAALFNPLFTALSKSRNQRDCPKLPDKLFSYLCAERVIENHPSGRGFLQSLGLHFAQCPQRSTFFESLKSPRRLKLMLDTGASVRAALRPGLADALAPFADLAPWDVYAADGHFWAAATHDEKQYRRGAKDDLAKFATGNLFSLCLRTHLMSHLILADQINKRKEHDMSALKRMTVAQLRQGADAGRKVLYVYDAAGIDFRYWHQCKAKGVYFLSIAKANLKLEPAGNFPWDREDEVNAGVLADELVDGGGASLRKVTYEDPKSGEVYVFITNVLTGLPPGLIAMLYKMRWDIEKVFEETKIKLGEDKAWGSSANAKQLQAEVVCVTHNLLLGYEEKLAEEDGLRNVAEAKRRAKRLKEAETLANNAGRKLNSVYILVQRITQRSVKFIRWLRVVLARNPDRAHAYAGLRELYRVT